MGAATTSHRGSNASLTLPSPTSLASPARTPSLFSSAEPHRDPTITSKTRPSRLRKQSSAKEDRGQLDLSKSTAENDQLAGLGIVDSRGPRYATDVTFSRVSRNKHSRTNSIGSQASNGSNSNRPGYHFTHPLKQTPGAYTPPPGDRASFFDSEELEETNNAIVEGEVLTPTGYISRRSMSTSSASQAQPAPSAQARGAADPVLLRQMTSNSQSNISLKSHHSATGKPSKLKSSRPSPEKGHSFESGPPSSARTSFDKAIGFVARRSEPEVVTQEELVQAARRKFEEKNALKELKYQREAEHRRTIEEAKIAKREQLECRRSEAFEVRDLPSTKAALKRLSGLMSGSTNSKLSHKNESAENINANPAPSVKERKSSPTESLQTGSYESYRSVSTPNPALFATNTDKPRAADKSRLSRLARRSSKTVGISWWFHTKFLSIGSRA
jgi:hypothetical protein